MVRPQRLACLPAEDASGEADAAPAALPPFDDGTPDLDIEAAELATKPNIRRVRHAVRPRPRCVAPALTRGPRRRYASAHPALRFPLFLFYAIYDNEALRKLIWTVSSSSGRLTCAPAVRRGG